MADNYLEKKFEEHFSNHAAHALKSHRAFLVSSRDGRVSFDFAQQQRVFIACEDAEIERATVAIFRRAEGRVAFCSAKSQARVLMSQQVGARYYPADGVRVTATSALTDVLKQWGGADIIVADGSLCGDLIALLPENAGVRLVVVNGTLKQQCKSVATANMVSGTAASASAIATAILFFTLPDSVAITGQVLNLP